MNRGELLGTLFAVLTAFESGFAIVANKFLIINIDPTLFTAIRALFIGVIFFILSLLQSDFKLKEFKEASWKILLIIGIVGGGIAFLLFFKGLKLTTSGRAAFLHKTLPLYVTLFAFLFLKEKITRKQLFAMALMFFGTWMILSAEIKPNVLWMNPNLGDLLIIGATVFWALENTLAKHAMIKEESKYTVTFARMFFGSILLFSALFLLGKGNLLFSISREQIIYIAISTALLFWYVFFYYSSLKYINVSKSATILLMAPLISLILGHLWLEEPIMVLQVIGSILIVFGAYFILKVRSRRIKIEG